MLREEIANLIQHKEGCYQVLRYFKYANHRFVCGKCGSESEAESDQTSETKCADCGRIESLTAGTFFHGHRKPIEKLMSIVLDVGISGGTSAAGLARKFDMVYSTVWEWQRKGRELIAAFFLGDNTQSVHHTFLQCVLFRRSTESEPSLSDEPLFAPNDAEERSVEAEPQENQAESDLEIREKEVPEPYDLRSVSIGIKYFSNLFHSGFSHKHARGYAAQFCFVVNYGGQVDKLLAACVRARAGPPLLELPSAFSPEFLTLPICR